MQARLALQEVTLTKASVFTPLSDIMTDVDDQTDLCPTPLAHPKREAAPAGGTTAGAPSDTPDGNVSTRAPDAAALRPRTGERDVRVGIVFDGRETAANSDEHFVNVAKRCVPTATPLSATSSPTSDVQGSAGCRWLARLSDCARLSLTSLFQLVRVS